MTEKACEVCRKPERTDTTEVRLSYYGAVFRVCGSCGYDLMVRDELADEEDSEADE